MEFDLPIAYIRMGMYLHEKYGEIIPLDIRFQIVAPNNPHSYILAKLKGEQHRDDLVEYETYVVEFERIKIGHNLNIWCGYDKEYNVIFLQEDV